jgi:hypothetical protein
MKFMIEWSTRPGSSYRDDLENRQALLQTFSKWSPPAGLTIHAFVVDVGNQRGWILVEADDTSMMTAFAARFMAWNDARWTPVADIEEAVAAYGDAFTWTASAIGG